MPAAITHYLQVERVVNGLKKLHPGFEYNKNAFSYLKDKYIFSTESSQNSFKSEYKIKKDYQNVTSSADNCYLLEIRNDMPFKLNFNYNIGFTSSNKIYSNLINVKCSFK